MTLREYRKAAGLTLAQLAKRLKITAPGLSKIERGIDAPSYKVALRIVEKTGVAFDKIAEPKDKRAA